MIGAMATPNLEEAAQVAGRACDLARKEILPRFRNVAVEFKADGSPVTEADRAAERAIRQVLEAAYPDFGLLGEEYGEREGGEGGLQWIVDPIDGTIAFSRGIPLFGTLIALIEDGEPVLGIIDLPALDERYVGWKGAGCRRNGQPVRVSQRTDLAQCLAGTGDRICFEWAGRQAGLERILEAIPLVRSYTDAFGHAMVLSGALDVMVDCDLNPWDAAATQLLAVEAGGACVTLRGARNKLDLIFGSPRLVEQVVDFLQVGD
jgi:histidinol phosphatase-like enzyme (inositol monophosphatase family)